MNFWLINCVAVFALCVLCAGVLIPQILLIAFRKQLMDIPNERKIHTSLVPRLGGIAFKPVIFFSMAFIFGVNLAVGNEFMLTETMTDAKAILFGFCAVLFLYLVGMADDLIGVRYRAKFAIQIFCAIMLVVGGVWLSNLYGVLWVHALPKWIGFPLTILVVVFITNAINLIDGIDGLASGLCGVAFLFYGIVFFTLGHYFYAMFSFATLGVLVPFFYYNVFGNAAKRQKIFMGDTGSLTIGIILSFLTIKLIACTPTGETIWPNPIILAFAPLFIPGFDVVRVYLHRIRTGSNPFLPDKNHIHHKLLALGMNQRAAMVSIISFSILLTLANVLMSLCINVNIIVLFDITLCTLLNVWISSKIRLKSTSHSIMNNDMNHALSNEEKKGVNYAEIDINKILGYINTHGGASSVRDIIDNSGAEPLRVYPLIYRLSSNGQLRITEYSTLGAPMAVEYCKNV